MKTFCLTILLICITLFSFAQAISTDSLILLLPFNGDARDQSGNHYDGVVNGATLTTGPDNQPNSAYYFNGKNNSIVIPNITKLDGTLTAFTILIRLQPQNVYKDPTVQPPFGTAYNFLTWHRNQTDSTKAFLNSKMRTAWQPPSSGTASSNAFLSYIMEWCNISSTASGYQKDTGNVNNQWLTVAYVYKGGMLQVYHNCKLENNWSVYPTKSEICGTEPIQISLGNVPLGAMQYGYRYFKGKIDELRVYTRALSEAEVQLFADSLCKAPPPPFEPKIQLRADPCYPNQFVLQDKSDTAHADFQRRVWNISTGDSTAVDSFAYAFTQPGTYNVKLTINTATGIYSKDTTIVVNTIGAKKFLSPQSVEEVLCEGQHFQPRFSGGVSYQWQPCADLSDCTAPNPVISPATDRQYKLISTDISGCKDTIDVKVSIIRDTVAVYVPSAFTPNNDGKNDGFGIANARLLTDFNLQIFNRWGQLVFQSSDPLQKWNGMLKGQPAPAGVYVWVMQYKSGQGCGSKQMKGTVALLR